ncbi:MAG: MBL fold metallo-hydrolase [Myxococcota bacterium]|nr:MBL fold metallo-hydrolase [Myxococcota bacterium]
MKEVLCVGTSDAFGAGGRRQSAYLVRSGRGTVLVDCGETTSSGLAALGVSREEVDAILVSHFHADHFGGIPLFVLGSVYADRRRRPLRVAGPPGIEDRVRRAASALGHPLDKQELRFPLRFEELRAEVAAEVGPVRVRAFETNHSPDACPHGLVLEEGGRRLVYSGDTGWFDGLPRQAAGADVFLCECTLEARGYEFHLSLEELAGRREAFRCHRFLITHLGAEMRARSDHAGFEVADDGMRIAL